MPDEMTDLLDQRPYSLPYLDFLSLLFCSWFPLSLRPLSLNFILISLPRPALSSDEWIGIAQFGTGSALYTDK